MTGPLLRGGPGSPMMQHDASTKIDVVEPTPQLFRIAKRALKRVAAFGGAIYFIPRALLVYVILGLIDVLRNRPFSWRTIERYFAGNGVFTWLLCPLNLLMDLLCLPYRNRGVYELEDLPTGYQDEIRRLIDVAYARDLVG